MNDEESRHCGDADDGSAGAVHETDRLREIVPRRRQHGILAVMACRAERSGHNSDGTHDQKRQSRPAIAPKAEFRACWRDPHRRSLTEGLPGILAISEPMLA